MTFENKSFNIYKLFLLACKTDSCTKFNNIKSTLKDGVTSSMKDALFCYPIKIKT